MRDLRKYITILFFVPIAYVQGQSATSDSLTLSGILNTVMSDYPSLKRVEKELMSADAKIDLTKTAYLPDVSFSTSYDRIGPVTSIDMPINGAIHTLQMYPENMYNATFSVNENIYDFGKTVKNVALNEKNKELVQLTVEQTKQQLSMAVMSNYYSICYLQEAIRIKDDQLNTLNEHLQFVQKKANTGSATQYDIMTTKVRMSAIENQKTDLQTALQIQISQLNSFLGKPQNNPLLLKKEIQVQPIVPSVDSLCNIAFTNRNEIKIARQKEEITKSRLDVIKVQNNPSINFMASGGFKNGYFNSALEDVGKLNFAVGVGFKVPIFDANRSKYTKIQANADLEGNQLETELMRRSITNEVVESRANAEAALKKVKQSELQLQQAMQAYDLANVSYKAGAVTNLDLLDSYTALSESKLVLFKTKIDYTVNLQRLKIAIGEHVY
jgi:outer membrane protein TolC